MDPSILPRFDGQTSRVNLEEVCLVEILLESGWGFCLHLCKLECSVDPPPGIHALPYSSNQNNSHRFFCAYSHCTVMIARRLWVEFSREPTQHQFVRKEERKAGHKINTAESCCNRHSLSKSPRMRVDTSAAYEPWPQTIYQAAAHLVSYNAEQTSSPSTGEYATKCAPRVIRLLNFSGSVGRTYPQVAGLCPFSAQLRF